MNITMLKEEIRRTSVSQKEGESPCNVTGYVAFCEYFNLFVDILMRLFGHSSTWMEGFISQVFTKLSVNTVSAQMGFNGQNQRIR